MEESTRFKAETSDLKRQVDDLQLNLNRAQIDRQNSRKELSKLRNSNYSLTEELRIQKHYLQHKVKNAELHQINYDGIDHKLIGKGEFGEINKARLNGKDFAIKRCKLDITTVHEVVISTHVDSPYVMRAEGIRLRDNDIWISMELMDSDLAKYLKDRSNEGSTVWRKEVCYQCSLSIEYLHSQNILHRDIKPQNYLIKVLLIKVSFSN